MRSSIPLHFQLKDSFFEPASWVKRDLMSSDAADSGAEAAFASCESSLPPNDEVTDNGIMNSKAGVFLRCLESVSQAVTVLPERSKGFVPGVFWQWCPTHHYNHHYHCSHDDCPRKPPVGLHQCAHLEELWGWRGCMRCGQAQISASQSQEPLCSFLCWICEFFRRFYSLALLTNVFYCVRYDAELIMTK